MANKRKAVSRQLYPWDRWFSRSSFKLVQGKDYHCQPHGMAAQVRFYAGGRGLRVFIRHSGKTMTVRTEPKR